MEHNFQKKLKTLINRPNNMHKGKAGKVAIIAGSSNMIGAAILACRAAFSLGAGYVYLYACCSTCF